MWKKCCVEESGRVLVLRSVAKVWCRGLCQKCCVEKYGKVWFEECGISVDQRSEAEVWCR